MLRRLSDGTLAFSHPQPKPDHAGQRPGANAGDLTNESSTAKIATFAYDFSHMPIHTETQATTQPNLTVSAPQDVYEQEADRVADHVMCIPEPELQSISTVSEEQPESKAEQPIPAHSQTSGAKQNTAGDAPPVVKDLLSSPGRPLERRTRRFFESRLGHDFSAVRIHTDARAADSARSVNALAYTYGQNVFFGTGQYAPETVHGRQTLAHELAHVVQQRKNENPVGLNGVGLTHCPAHIQPKLALTGKAADVARVVAIMNAGLGPINEARVNKAGEVEIVPSGQQGPPTRENQFFTDKLQSIVAESGTTTVGVTSGGMPIVGSYELSQIDIADIEQLGIGKPGWDARAALLHELAEQREKQLGAKPEQRAYGSATSGAHGKGLAAELGMLGAILESDTGLVGATANPNGTMNGTRTVVFKYPDGTRYRVEVTLDHNNITDVKRTKLP